MRRPNYNVFKDTVTDTAAACGFTFRFTADIEVDKSEFEENGFSHAVGRNVTITDIIDYPEADQEQDINKVSKNDLKDAILESIGLDCVMQLNIANGL
jgi:hypothetical protein